MGSEYAVEMIAPDALSPHPSNYRGHPDAQVDEIAHSITTFGQYRPLVVSLDGVILAGHGVWLAAQKAGLPNVAIHRMGFPADDQRAEKLLVADNELSRMAEDDDTALAALLASVQATSGLEGTGFDDAALDRMIGELAAETPMTGNAAEEGADADAEPPEDLDEMPPALDFMFTTEPEWGIPVLDPTLQLEGVVSPCIPWGSIARSSRMPGVWHFYTEDYKFGALWRRPETILQTACYGVIEPNWSVYTETPRAIGLYNTFRKRWMARYWQSCGVRVAVDLNVSGHAAEDNLLGIPDGWNAFATRGYTERMDATEREYELACRIAGHSHPLFVVVGGGGQVRGLCAQRGWTHIGEEMDRNG